MILYTPKISNYFQSSPIGMGRNTCFITGNAVAEIVLSLPALQSGQAFGYTIYVSKINYYVVYL
jgi:hypothetical protein